MRSARDHGRYPRVRDLALRSPLMQPGLTWSTIPTTTLPPDLRANTLRYRDPGDVLGLLASTVGPPTAACVLDDTVVGAASWEQIPLMTQYDAVTTRAAAFVAGAMNYLRLTGPDAVRVLDLLTPKDITRLPVHQGSFVLFTTTAGTVDNDAVVLRAGEQEYLVSCGGPSRDPSWLPDALGLYPEVEVSKPAIGSFNIKGPQRMAVMATLLHPDSRQRAAALRPFEACRARTIAGQQVWILRTRIGVEMWGDGEALRTSWERILQLPRSVTPVGWDLLDIVRLECTGMLFALFPVDLHGGTTLWEAGFGWMADVAKRSDFIGRASLRESMRHRRLRLAGAVSPHEDVAVPHLGEEIVTPAGEFAGYVTTAAYSPRFQCPVAFTHLKPSCEDGQEVVINGDLWTVTSLPFSHSAAAGMRDTAVPVGGQA